MSFQSSFYGILSCTHFNFSGGDRPSSIAQTPDGGFVMGGWTYRYDPDQRKEILEGLVIKTDSAGHKQWTRHFPHEWGMGFNETIVYDNNILIIGGQSQKNDINTTGIVFALDMNGDMEWQSYYDDWYSFDPKLAKVLEDEGSVVIAGEIAQTREHATTGMLMKIKPETGEKLWLRKFYYDKRFNRDLNDIAITPDNGFVISGYAVKETRPQMWLAKVDSIGCDSPDCAEPIGIAPQQKRASTPSLGLYPNPATKQVTINFSRIMEGRKPRGTLRVYNSKGKEVKALQVNKEQLTMSTAKLPAGLYQVQWVHNRAVKATKQLLIE